MGGWLMGQDNITGGKTSQGKADVSYWQQQVTQGKQNAFTGKQVTPQQAFALQSYGFAGLGSTKPTESDSTDAAVKARKFGQVLSQISGRGRAQSMLGTGYADTGSMLGGL